MPATVEAVRTFLGLAPARPVDDDALSSAVAGSNATVFSLRPDLGDPADDATVWPANCDQAAVMYAARLYGRRGSVMGIAAFADAGARLLSEDPDVALMLELGGYQKSVVA
jgi:hypothetical protein